MKRENVKKTFDIDGFKYYSTKNGILRKGKLCTSEKSTVISAEEFMNAWNKHFDLYYA
jgi:hypothetical protein